MMNDFFENFANAMRVGEPGLCFVSFVSYFEEREGIGTERIDEPDEVRSYHTLDGDAVRTLQGTAGGGLTPCLDCGKSIFVPQTKEAPSFVVHDLPGGINMKGISL